MLKIYDKIDMRVMPAGTLKHPWQDSNRCIILLNGKELLSYIRDAEITIFKQYGLEESPSELYGYLSDSVNSIEDKDIPIMCCTCDEIGCASVRINIIKKQNSVIWKNFRSVRDEWDWGETFEFDEQEYSDFLRRIRSTSNNR